MMTMAARPRQGGFVLLVVLSAVMALCALLFAFTRTTRMSLAQADSFYRTEQAWNGAWGGLQLALALIRDANEAGPDPQYARRLTAENTFAVGDANCAVVLAAENGLLNVNHLMTPDGQIDRRRVDQFLRLIDVLNRQEKEAPPLAYGLVPALLDWVDKNDDVTCLPFVQRDNLGAENDYYQTRSPPYPCRNGPVRALEELLWVKGMTPAGFARLRPALTCLGDGKIDINAAPKPVLQSLSEQMDAALADRIIQQRKQRPFQSLGELRQIPGMTDAVAGAVGALGTVRSKERFYRVTAQGRLQDYHCTIEALLRQNTQAGTVDIIQYREL
jgi:general secretion pathway protein K